MIFGMSLLKNVCDPDRWLWLRKEASEILKVEKKIILLKDNSFYATYGKYLVVLLCKIFHFGPVPELITILKGRMQL